MRYKTELLALGIALAMLAAAPAAAASTQRFAALIAAAEAAMNAEPEKALSSARAAGKVAASLDGPRNQALASARAGWLQGEALLRINSLDEAKPIIAAALASVVSFERGGKLHGDLMRSSAAVESMTGKIQKALADLQAAHGIFAKLGEERSQAMVLQDIGTIYFDARDYARALRYDAQAVEAYAGDPGFTVAVYNNSGETLKEMGRFGEAIVFYRKALKLARDIDSSVLELRILTNLASAYAQSGKGALAQATADRALAAADGTEWEPFLWGVKAQVALSGGRLDEAQRFVERTFAGADLETTTTQYREFHEIASRLYRTRGDADLAFTHLAAFKRLDDELREIAVSTNAELMSARFDFTNQELSISKLKAGQLQRDIALERSKVQLNKFTLYALGSALVVAALVLAGAVAGLFSLRRSRNEVARANDNLSGVNAELESALEAKTRFLATTSHEIRTPLNGILGMTQVMLHDRDLGDVQRDRVRIVHDAGETMKALVDDILDVAKMKNGTVSLDANPVAMRDMLEGVARLWTGQAENKGLTLDVNVQDCPVRILGDERRLRQIVFNLLSNAIKFTENGSVTLHAAHEGDLLTLRVTDTGIGIPEDQFEAVFASFHQVDSGTTRRYGGTGLGLSICSDLVRAMGGSIELESELGQGSTFIVRLPVLVPVVTDIDRGTGEWPSSLAETRLLVIEDNPLARSIIAASLTPSVQSIVAVSGAEAVQTVSERHFHHAIIDCVALADIDAPLDLISTLTGGPGGGTVTLLAAAAPATEIYAGYMRAGATQLLARPIAPADLIAALKQLHDERSSVAPATSPVAEAA